MRKKRPVSIGSIVMAILTVIVLASGLFLFAKIGNQGDGASLNPRVLISTFSALHDGTQRTSVPSASPASTIRTTVVTVAPGALETPSSSATPIAATAEITPAPETPLSFSLTAGGMAWFRTELSDAAYSSATKTFDFSGMLSEIAPFVQGDLTLVTLEGLLTGRVNKYSNLSFPPEAALALKTGGFNTALIHHDHILDLGVDGLNKTAAALQSAGMTVAGVQTEGALGTLINKNGVNIGMLAYTEGLSNRTKSALKENETVLKTLDLESAVRDIKSLKAEGAQVVLVFLHWGKEDAESVTSSQRETAQRLASAGADVIIGTNTTRILPLELIKNGDRETLVAYSLGSFLTDVRSDRGITSSYLLHATINVSPTSGKVSFGSISYTPTYIWRQRIDRKTVFRILPSAQTPPAEMNDDQKKNMSNALAYVNKLLAEGPAKLR